MGERPVLLILGQQRLSGRGLEALDTAGFDAFAAAAGDAVVMFAEDPVRVPETWDSAVILPEILKALPATRAAFLPPEAAHEAAVVERLRAFEELFKKEELANTSPLMTLSFMALPVIPKLKITDRGLVDVERFCPVDLFAD